MLLRREARRGRRSPLIQSWRGAAGRAKGVVRRLVRDAVEVLAEPLGRRRPVVWLALSVGARVAWAGAAGLIARSLDIELSVADALFVAAVLNLGSAIPY